jgi:phasin family protein
VHNFLDFWRNCSHNRLVAVQQNTRHKVLGHPPVHCHNQGCRQMAPNRRINRNENMSDKKKMIDAVETIKSTTADVATKSYDQTVSGLKDGMAQATAGMEQTQAKMKEGMAKAMKTAEELVTFGQGNIEAFTRSSQIWATGVQELSKQVAETAKISLEESMSAFKTLGTVKSLKEAIDLQSSMARHALEKAMSESGKLTDASIKLTEQAMAPITARVNLAVEKFSKAA